MYSKAKFQQCFDKLRLYFTHKSYLKGTGEVDGREEEMCAAAIRATELCNHFGNRV